MSDESSHIVRVDVERADPHNDQMAARASEDLDRHVESTRKLLTDAAGDVGVAMAVIATALHDEESFGRDRLAALLAAAMVRLVIGEIPERES